MTSIYNAGYDDTLDYSESYYPDDPEYMRGYRDALDDLDNFGPTSLYNLSEG